MAIAFDAAADGFQSSGTSLIYSHTCTGSNLLLLVGIYSWNGTQNLTSITYGGRPMVMLGTRAADGTGGFIFIYGLLNPSTGANNIVISYSGLIQIFASSASYTGVSQTGLPDSVTSNSSAGTSFTTTTTVIANNSWLFEMERGPSRVPTAGAGTFLRRQNAASGDASNLLDSNGAVGTGSQSLIYTVSPSQTCYNIMVSFAPALPQSTITGITSITL